MFCDASVCLLPVSFGVSDCLPAVWCGSLCRLFVALCFCLFVLFSVCLCSLIQSRLYFGLFASLMACSSLCLLTTWLVRLFVGLLACVIDCLLSRCNCVCLFVDLFVVCLCSLARWLACLFGSK